MSIRRGEVYWATLDPVKGSEQAGHRPVVIIQNDIGNESIYTTIIAPLTTKKFSQVYPTNVSVPKGIGALKEESTILFSQIRTIDKLRLGKKIAVLPPSYVDKMDEAIRASLGV